MMKMVSEAHDALLVPRLVAPLLASPCRIGEARDVARTLRLHALRRHTDWGEALGPGMLTGGPSARCRRTCAARLLGRTRRARLLRRPRLARRPGPRRLGGLA